LPREKSAHIVVLKLYQETVSIKGSNDIFVNPARRLLPTSQTLPLTKARKH
jgi:hypothetical protein